MYSQWLKTSAGALALTALLTASHGAYAQDASATSTEDAEARQETVTVTGSVDAFGATKTDIPIVETARSVSVEPEDVFIERGALNLSQTVSYVTGVTAETYGFSTRGDWVSSRGLSIPRYRDSIQELFGSYNTTRVEPWTVEQVEILRGPASVLYGQGSPGGLLNVVSKTPEEDFGGSLAAELGNFERYQIAGDVTGPVPGSDGQLLYRLVGLYRNTGSQVDYVDEESGVFMPSLTWIPSEDTRLTIIGIHQDTKGDVAAQFIPVEGTLFPHNVTGEYIDQDVYAGEPDFNFFDTKSDQITLLGEHRVNDVWNIEATALWRSGEADYQQAWPTFTGAGQSRYLNQYFGAPLFTETTVARTFYAADNTSEQYALDLRARADFTTGSLTHNMLMGAQYQDVETDSNTAYYLGGGVLSGKLKR